MSEHQAEVIAQPKGRSDSIPEVSVLIPVYNRYASLIRTVKSVEHPNCEIIIVDDGSKTPIQECLEEAQLLDPETSNITLVRKSNGGVSSARNVALSYARGKYIAYLDSDDVFVPGKLEKMIQVLDDNPDVHFAFHDLSTFRVAENGRIRVLEKLHSDFFPQMLNSGRKGKQVGPDSYRIPSMQAYANLTGGCPIFPSSVLQRASKVPPIGPWNETCEVCGDMEYFARSLRTTDAIYVHQTLTQKGAGNDNLSHSWVKQLTADIRILKEMAPTTPKPYKETLVRSLARRLRALGYLNRERGNVERAKKAYRESLAYRFSPRTLLNLVHVNLMLKPGSGTEHTAAAEKDPGIQSPRTDLKS